MSMCRTFSNRHKPTRARVSSPVIAVYSTSFDRTEISLSLRQSSSSIPKQTRLSASLSNMNTFLKKKAEIDNMVSKVFGELEEEIERDFKSYDVAEWYYRAGDFDSAHNYINKFLSVDPDNVAALDLLVKILEGLISADRLPSPDYRHFEFHHEADSNDIALEESPTHLNEAHRYVLWRSCLADVNQARSSLNTSLDRLTTPVFKRNHSKLIWRLVEITQQLLDVEIAMFNHDALSEDNSSELFPEEVLGFGETQERREDSTAFQQTSAFAQQNKLLEKLQLQATANERLLKSALDEISSLRKEVRSLQKSSAVQTEPSESPS